MGCSNLYIVDMLLAIIRTKVMVFKSYQDSRGAKVFALILSQFLKAHKSAKTDFGIELMLSLIMKIAVLKKKVNIYNPDYTLVGAQMTEGAPLRNVWLTTMYGRKNKSIHYECITNDHIQRVSASCKSIRKIQI